MSAPQMEFLAAIESITLSTRFHSTVNLLRGIILYSRCTTWTRVTAVYQSSRKAGQGTAVVEALRPQFEK
jgi:hypothetical protein